MTDRRTTAPPASLEGAPSSPVAGDVSATERSPMLEVHDVSHAFGPTQALNGVSITIDRGEIHGLCGQNGAGKSTLVKVITGLVRPDTATIRMNGEEVDFHGPRDAQAAGIAVVDQELSVIPELTVEENIRLGSVKEPFVRRRSNNDVVDLLRRVGLEGISPRAKAESLSIPQRQLVETARVLARDASLLILDEPTASLSRGDSEIIFAALRQLIAHGHSVLYVSHRLDEVMELCDTVTVIRNGRKVAGKSIAELDQSRLIELILGEEGLRDNEAVESRIEHHDEVAGQGVPVVIDRISVPGRVDDFQLRFSSRDVIGLAGQVGSGSSELLRAIAGLEDGADVEVTVGGERIATGSPRAAAASGVNFVSNDRRHEGLFLTRPISHNLVATRLGAMLTRPPLGALGVLSMRRIGALAESLSQRVALKARSIFATPAELSGGNQQKVFIGRTLDREPNRLLLLDEPTRGVDVGGRAEIHKLVRRASAGDTAVIFASSEAEEILALADIVVCLHAGRIAAVLPRSEASLASILANTTAGESPALEEGA